MKVYSPLKDLDHRIQDSEYGYQVDKINARTTLLLIIAFGFITLSIFVYQNVDFLDIDSDTLSIARYVPVVIFGLTTLWLINKAMTRLELYERGIIYKQVFRTKRYSYDDLFMVYEDRENMNARNHYKYSGDGLFSRMHSYHVACLQFNDGKNIKLSTPCFWKVKKKIRSLNQNLIEVDR